MTVPKVENSPDNSKEFSPIERLPKVVWGRILCQLILVTGTEGILKEVDISTVMRNALSVALASKTLFTQITTAATFRPFICEIAAKSGHTEATVLARFENEGLRSIIDQHIEQNGYEQEYNAILEIRKITDGFLLGPEVNFAARIEANNTISLTGAKHPCRFYTKQGIFLCLSSFRGERSIYLCSPFGSQCFEVMEDLGERFFFSAAEAVIKGMNATFHHFSVWGNGNSEVSLVEQSKDASFFSREDADVKTITVDEATALVGTHNLMFNNERISVYQIHGTTQNPLPDALQCEKHSAWGQLMWERLEAKNQKNNPIDDLIRETKYIELSQYEQLSPVICWVRFTRRDKC